MGNWISPQRLCFTPIRYRAPYTCPAYSGSTIRPFSSVSMAESAGSNSTAAFAGIGDGSVGNWEVFQFADAVRVAEDTFELSNRRCQ